MAINPDDDESLNMVYIVPESLLELIADYESQGLSRSDIDKKIKEVKRAMLKKHTDTYDSVPDLDTAFPTIH